MLLILLEHKVRGLDLRALGGFFVNVLAASVATALAARLVVILIGAGAAHRSDLDHGDAAHGDPHLHRHWRRLVIYYITSSFLGSTTRRRSSG